MRGSAMKRLLILLGFALALGTVSPAAAADNPLDGEVFLSLQKLAGGERRDGSFDLIHWTITFKGDSFQSRQSDTISKGGYKYDTRTGKIAVEGIDASYDAKTGVLTWGKIKYKAVPRGR